MEDRVLPIKKVHKIKRENYLPEQKKTTEYLGVEHGISWLKSINFKLIFAYTV